MQVRIHGKAAAESQLLGRAQCRLLLLPAWMRSFLPANPECQGETKSHPGTRQGAGISARHPHLHALGCSLHSLQVTPPQKCPQREAWNAMGIRAPCSSLLHPQRAEPCWEHSAESLAMLWLQDIPSGARTKFWPCKTH